MEIKFTPLNPTHFPLLLNWLTAEHVCKWWDKDIVWTPELVAEKYTSYTQGLKDQKTIYAYVFYEGETPIGYIQYYDIHDFPRDIPITTLGDIPFKSAALDFYIGDLNYLRKGYGGAVLRAFYNEAVWQKFDACFVYPARDNEVAKACYKSAGFGAFSADYMVIYRSGFFSF